MAIITPKLRYTVAQSFVDMIAAKTGSNGNAYFFIGRSRPWLDPDAHVGTGRIRIAAGSTTLTVDTDTGNFDELVLNSTIKNLDTGEVRIIKQKNTSTQCTVNFNATVPWDTRNWAWKEPDLGFVWQDDNNPPQPNGSQYNQNESFNHMLALKKIDVATLGQTASFVIPRFNWQTGLVYFPYSDNDGELYNHPTPQDVQAALNWQAFHTTDTTPEYRTYTPGSHFIVVNEGSNYFIYKCLDNGFKLGLKPDSQTVYEPKPCKSTSRPTYTQHNSVNNWTNTYPDGYTWKFMYALSSDQALRYLTDSWVPVKLASTQESGQENDEQVEIQEAATADRPGSIETVRVTRSILPATYTSGGTTYVYYFGDGTLATPAAGQLLPAQDTRMDYITLPAGASGVSNNYVGADVFVFSADQNRDGSIKKIISYDGPTKVARVESVYTSDEKPHAGDHIVIAPHITFTGKIDTGGREASARAIVNANGYIVSVRMLDIGKSYRLAQAIASTMPGGTDSEDIPCTGITLKAEVAPRLGHGSNAVEELGAYYLMLFLQLKNIEGDVNADQTRDFMLTNDYRSIGLVFDVLAYGGTQYASGNTLKAVKTLELVNTLNDQIFFPDELIECPFNGARGYVIEHTPDPNNSALGTLTYVQDFYTGFGEFAVGHTINGLTSSTTASVSSVENSEIADSTGDIIYIEQRKPINRAPEQLEDIKLVIEF
jgi:hypothetical protein